MARVAGAESGAPANDSDDRSAATTGEKGDVSARAAEMGARSAALDAKRRERPFLPLRPVVFMACLVPLAKIAVDGVRGDLTANPIAEVMNRLGFWTLTLLLSSLAATPLKMLFGFVKPMRMRKMLGLFAFFYGCLHFATYLVLDQAFDFLDIGADLVKRKFITVGFAALLTLVPLAVTSTDRAVKRLGFRRWKRIHRLVYLAAMLGVVHFVWRVKADYQKPALFAVVLVALLVARLLPARSPRAAQPAAQE
jgi:sulfoxide reductase heme-binding subunit YedZ